MNNSKQIPAAFIWRRVHSLIGIWLVLFLIEHLLTNSQAALWFGDDGNGFVRGVNFIQGLPYLRAIEILLLGVPILIHIIWGIIYLWTGQINSYTSDGTTPSLGKFPRNHAYTWQRITSWILIATLAGHVIHMRFIEYPAEAQLNEQHYYMVRLDIDNGLFTLAERLGVQLFDQKTIKTGKIAATPSETHPAYSAGMWDTFVDSFRDFFRKPSGSIMKSSQQKKLLTEQQKQEHHEFIQALESRPLKQGQVIAVAKDFGTAELLVVRETFKMPIMIALYSILVLAACFHACNGLWTFFITWGVNLTVKSQRIFRRVSTALMALLTFLGLAAIWLTYWINLKQ